MQIVKCHHWFVWDDHFNRVKACSGTTNRTNVGLIGGAHSEKQAFNHSSLQESAVLT